MTLDLSAYIEGRLEMDAQGLWQAPGVSGPLAYPEAGNRLFREVEDISWWFSHRNRVILALVRRFPPLGVLWDIGGGNGAVASHLQKNGFPCALLEAGGQGCRNALGRGVQTVVQGRIEEMHFKESSLEAIGLFDVLEHAENPDELLRRLARALSGRGKGRFYLTVPAHAWLWSGEDAWAGHFRRFTLKPLLLLLRRHGFRPLYHTFFFSLLSPFIFLVRGFPFRLGRGRIADPEKRAGQIQKVHSSPTGPARRLLERHLAAELNKLGRERISHGSSLLVICDKP